MSRRRDDGKKKPQALAKSEATASKQSPTPRSSKEAAVQRCEKPDSGLPQEVQDALYVEYASEINGVRPRVPATWVINPMSRKPVRGRSRYVTQEDVRARIQSLIALIGTSRNVKPLEDLLAFSKGANSYCELVRDYNGEFAPCIAAVKAGARCIVVPAQKPDSMKKTAEEVGIKVDAKRYEKMSVEEKKDYMEKLILDSDKRVDYFNAERTKCEQLAGSLLVPSSKYSQGPGSFVKGAQGFKPPQGEKKSMNGLHELWVAGDALKQFCDRVTEFRQDNLAADEDYDTWVRDAVNQFPLTESGSKKVKPADDNTVTFSLWIRLQQPQNHSHNMSEDLLYEITDAQGQIMRHLHKDNTSGMCFQFLLFGDAGDMASLWNHKSGKSSMTKGTIADFITKIFRAAIKDKDAVIRVRDLREMYKQPEKIRPEESRGSGNLNQWEQYAFMQGANDVLKSSFMMGCESGNMDGFGYCGTPVVSIDVEDQNAQMESLLDDRIGQYSLLSPLFSVLNYHNGTDQKRFREFLYGHILMNTEFAASAGDASERDGADGAASIKDKKPKVDPFLKSIEASRSTGGNEKEKEGSTEKFEKQFQEEFDVVDVKGDGNCLFRALSLACLGHEKVHEDIRKQAVEFASAIFDIVEINAGSGEDFESPEIYAKTMSEPATKGRGDDRWGGDVELSAFAILNEITIRIHVPGTDQPHEIIGGTNRTIDLCYVNRNHYMALKSKPTNT